MSAPVALARYLHSLDLVVYDEAGAGGNCFTGRLPAQPDLAVSVRQYGGSGDIKFPIDTPRVQVRVRAPTSDAALALAEDIYEAVQALTYLTLDPGGDAEKNVIEIRAMDLPSDIGQDENGRQEFVTNYEIEHMVSSARRDW